MSKVEKLRKKAEDAWTDCDSCNSNDKSMWINGYIVGALANPIELPTNEEIERKSVEYSTDTETKEFYKDCCWDFQNGAKWMRDKIKGGDNENN